MDTVTSLDGSTIAFDHAGTGNPDRKSTRLNSSHANISYAAFCLKKTPELNAGIILLVYISRHRFRPIRTDTRVPCRSHSLSSFEVSLICVTFGDQQCVTAAMPLP